MTISWGGMGTLWFKPVVTVYVRPNRYTYEFMENHDHFTISFFPEEYHKDLEIMGTVSGRDGDKFAKTRFTPEPAAAGKAVGFKEAEVTIICKKIYEQPMNLSMMPEDVVKECYSDAPVSHMFIGEVMAVVQWRTDGT